MTAQGRPEHPRKLWSGIFWQPERCPLGRKTFQARAEATPLRRYGHFCPNSRGEGSCLRAITIRLASRSLKLSKQTGPTELYWPAIGTERTT